MQCDRRRLDDVLKLDEDRVDVDTTANYPMAGVFGFGRGVFAREPISGSETSYRGLNRIRAGQLVISRLKAFEGAIAVVPPELDSYFVSPEFPTFSCVEDQLEPGYLRHLCRWPDLWSMLAATSKGIGSRRERVHARDLLQLKLSIPSIDEQRVLTVCLDRIADVGEKAARLATRTSELSAAFVASLTARPDLTESMKSSAGWRRVKLNELISFSRDQVRVEAGATYPNLGIYSFGGGVFGKPDIDGSSTSASTLFRVRGGQFIYSRLFAFEGAYACVPNDFDGYYVSNEFPTFEVDADQVNVRWLASYLRSPDRWAELGGSSKGIGVRRQRVPVDAVLSHEIWLPPITEQRRVVAMIETVEQAAAARHDAIRRMEALVGSTLNAVFTGLN